MFEHDGLGKIMIKAVQLCRAVLEVCTIDNAYIFFQCPCCMCIIRRQRSLSKLDISYYIKGISALRRCALQRFKYHHYSHYIPCIIHPRYMYTYICIKQIFVIYGTYVYLQYNHIYTHTIYIVWCEGNTIK